MLALETRDGENLESIYPELNQTRKLLGGKVKNVERVTYRVRF